MKKILIITLEFPPQIGGIATYVRQFAEALAPENLILLAPRHQNSKEFDKNFKFTIIRRNLYFPRFLWPRWIRLCWQVFWLAKKEKIGIIYLHHVLPVGYIGLLIKKLLKIPYLVFSHGTDIEYALKRRWKRRMFKKVTALAEQVIFNSESLRRRCLEILPELEPKSLVLYPCPDSSFYQAPGAEEISRLKTLYALEGKKVILSVGRIGDGKGFTHLLRIFPEILKQVPNAVWLIIGDGSKRDWLLHEAQKKSLQSIMRYIGEIPHAQLKLYYYLADLFVLLTHPDEGREEGLGLVFLEAGACGLPVVAGKSGGVEEGVVNGETGLVVDIYKGDKTVVEAIVKLLQNSEYAKKLGQNARERMKSDFNWPEQIAKL